MTKEEFENTKKIINDERVSRVKRQYRETLEEAVRNKEEYERYMNEKNWDFALLSYAQYQKYDILAMSFKAYLDTLNITNESSQDIIKKVATIPPVFTISLEKRLLITPTGEEIDLNDIIKSIKGE